MPEPVHPWQADAWAHVRTMRIADRLPHALLVAGPPGTGVRDFAEVVARAVLCEAGAEEAPCDGCRACRLYRAGTHPDAVRVEPAEAGKAIPIDAIRELAGRMALTGGSGGKVALIDPAESMTTAAANSLLKTLEEPAGVGVLVLVSRRIARLPATVRSRCQRVVFGLPEPEAAASWLSGQGVGDAAAWLARAGGAPLAARAMATAGEEETAGVDRAAEALLSSLEHGVVPADALAEAGRLPLATSVPVLTATVEDLVRLMHAPESARLRRPDQRERMSALAARLDARALFDYLDGLYRSVPGASSSLRADMQLQGLLADAAGIGGPGTRDQRG